MSEEPRPTFRVAVVGALATGTVETARDPEARQAAARLAVFLDRVTVRAREHHRLCLTTFTHGPGTTWAKARGHSIILIPRLGETITAERELLEFSDAVVVIGNPAKWARLVRLAGELGKPVRFFAG